MNTEMIAGGASFAPKTVIITRRCDRCSQNIRIIMYRLDGIHKEGEEHQVGLWRFTGSQQVNTCIGSHAPVVVFTTSVDAGKWFFMQQYSQFMTAWQRGP